MSHPARSESDTTSLTLEIERRELPSWVFILPSAVLYCYYAMDESRHSVYLGSVLISLNIKLNDFRLQFRAVKIADAVPEAERKVLVHLLVSRSHNVFCILSK